VPEQEQQLEPITQLSEPTQKSVVDWVDKIKFNRIQICALTALWDALPPKLLRRETFDWA
jgi:hypothetical protein